MTYVDETVVCEDLLVLRPSSPSVFPTFVKRRYVHSGPYPSLSTPGNAYLSHTNTPGCSVALSFPAKAHTLSSHLLPGAVLAVAGFPGRIGVLEHAFPFQTPASFF